MAKYLSSPISQNVPALTGDEYGEVMCAKFAVAVDTSLALNDLLLFGKLPAGHEVVDCVVASDQIDSNGSPTLTLSVAVLNDAGSDIVASTELIKTNTAIGRAAGGSVVRMDQITGVTLPVYTAMQSTDKGTQNTYVPQKNGDRIIVGKVTAAGATKVAGNVYLNLYYRAT